MSHYFLHRLARLPASAHSIAAGFACGAAASFTPFVGLHFVLAAFLAVIMRVNILSSAIGTAVGNPWTFPFIWVWVFEVGKFMGATGQGGTPGDINFDQVLSDITHGVLHLDFSYLVDSAWPVFWPMFIGAIPTGAVVWFLFYVTLRPVIGSYQARRLHRRSLANSNAASTPAAQPLDDTATHATRIADAPDEAAANEATHSDATHTDDANSQSARSESASADTHPSSSNPKEPGHG